MRIVWLAALLALSISIPEARAALDNKKIVEATKAAEEFVRRAKDSHVSGKPPRQSDAAIKTLLDTAFNTSALGTEPAAFADVPRINEWMLSGLKVGVVYLLAGTGTNDIAKAGADPKAIDRINKNVAEFNPEYGRYCDFQIILAGSLLEAVQSKLATAPKSELENPKFKAGFAQMSGGVAQTLVGVLTTFVTEGIDDDWRRGRLGPIVNIGPKIAKVLSADELAQLKEIAMEVSDAMTDAQIKAGLKSFADTLTK